MKVGKTVTITLTTDPSELNKESSELDLFYQRTETFSKLTEIAKENDIVIESPIHLQENGHSKQVHSTIEHLEKYFDKRPTPSMQSEREVPITVAEAIHPRAELERSEERRVGKECRARW